MRGCIFTLSHSQAQILKSFYVDNGVHIPGCLLAEIVEIEALFSLLIVEILLSSEERQKSLFES